MLADATERTGLPVPVDPRVIYGWADGLGIPTAGDTMIFTGGLYQLIPYIDRAVEFLSRAEGLGGWALGLADVGMRFSRLARPFLRPSGPRVQESRGILRDIYQLVRRAGPSPSYPPGVDWYSGVLLYDLGLDDVFSGLARKVYGRLRDAGIRRAITVDPHTTYMLRRIYPKYVDGYDLEVVNYLELLDGSASAMAHVGDGRKVTIHDPCYYARYLDLRDQPRHLLRAAGYSVVEPSRSRRNTYCCGGPIEGLSPGLSALIAKRRATELASASDVAVTMCPICLGNLSRASQQGLRLVDISRALSREIS